MYRSALCGLGMFEAAREAAKLLPRDEVLQLPPPEAANESKAAVVWALFPAFPTVEAQPDDGAGAGPRPAAAGEWVALADKHTEAGRHREAATCLLRALQSAEYAVVGDVLTQAATALVLGRAWEAALGAAAAGGVFFAPGAVKRFRTELRYAEAAAQLGLDATVGSLGVGWAVH